MEKYNYGENSVFYTTDMIDSLKYAGVFPNVNTEVQALQDKVKELESQVSQLRSEKESQTQMLEKSQRMLNSVLKFSEKVRNSKLGKIFFRKQIKELDAGSQPQGKDSSKPQDFDDIEF